MLRASVWSFAKQSSMRMLGEQHLKSLWPQCSLLARGARIPRGAISRCLHPCLLDGALAQRAFRLGNHGHTHRASWMLRLHCDEIMLMDGVESVRIAVLPRILPLRAGLWLPLASLTDSLPECGTEECCMPRNPCTTSNHDCRGPKGAYMLTSNSCLEAITLAVLLSSLHN